MRLNVTGPRFLILGAALLLGATCAEARPVKVNTPSHGRVAITHTAAIVSGMKGARIGGHGRKLSGRQQSVSYGGFLQCVPFARENSGIELAGNASAWWSAADGVYERGARPEVGSVLNFRANGRMRMGHVAVVSRVVNPRLVEIDHANWSGPGGGRGSVSRNVTVVDVSDRNDWSAVRVGLGRDDEFGSVYPTYGFIYDRPDRGVMVANSATAPMLVALNAPPRDLRPRNEQVASDDEPVEVAEATTRSSVHHRISHRSKVVASIHRHRA